MKKIIVVVVLLVLAFALVIPAAAGGNGPGATGRAIATGTGAGTGSGQGQPGGRGTFTLTGIIANIGTDTVTIDVLRGNKLTQPYLGTQVTLTLTAGTRYLLRDGTTVTIISLTDLKEGQPVSVSGVLANGVWTVSRITVGASLSCLP